MKTSEEISNKNGYTYRKGYMWVLFRKSRKLLPDNLFFKKKKDIRKGGFCQTCEKRDVETSKVEIC